MFDKLNKPTYTINIDKNGVFLPALALLFIYLKLTGTIAWSWWWVLSPIWIPAAISFIVTFIVAFVFAAKK